MPTTTTPTKTVDTSVLSLQSVASNTTVISSDVDVSSKFVAMIGVHFGRRASTALTEGVEIRVEASTKSSGNGHWFPIASWKTATIAAEPEAVSGTVSSGTNVITVASTSNLIVFDRIFLDNGTIANSEWGVIKSLVSNTSITIEDTLVNAQTGATIYNKAELFSAVLDVSAIKRIRLVVNAGNTGQAVAVEAEITFLDSVNAA